MVAKRITSCTGCCDIGLGVSPSVLSSEQVFSGAAELPCLGLRDSMGFGKGFWRALPHQKAAVAAFPILAFEGRLTVFFDGVLGHIGLLYLKEVRVLKY